MVESALLRNILQEEVELLEKMDKTEEETGYILIQGDAKALEKLNLHKDELLQKLNAKEKQRREILPPGITLKEFLAREDPPEARDLQGLRNRLLQLQSSLKRKQKVNLHLLNYNLRFLEHALKILFPRREGLLYASGGQVKQSNYSSALVDSNA
jgi:flagellar biosynthesis/type III secretory pathway chaperone